MSKDAKSKPTIEELEKILNETGEAPIEILPNGELRIKTSLRERVEELEAEVLALQARNAQLVESLNELADSVSVDDMASHAIISAALAANEVKGE